MEGYHSEGIDRLKKWGQVDLGKFKKAKCKVFHLSQDNPENKYRLSRELIENRPA